MILGIDPGTHTGWALLNDDGKRIGSGVWDLSPMRHEGAGMRYLRLRTYLRGLCEGYTLTAIAYEEVAAHKGTAAAHIYGGVVATMQAWAEFEEIPYRGIPVGTVKKIATGKGNAGKDAMVTAALVRWPEIGMTSEGGETLAYADEADALWIAETLRRELGGEG